MIPYGRRNKLRKNYPDNHPPKGYVNWWEAECGSVVNKKLKRRNARQQIEEDVYENRN